MECWVQGGFASPGRVGLALVPDLGTHARGAGLAEVFRLLGGLVQQRGAARIVGPVPAHVARGANHLHRNPE